MNREGWSCFYRGLTPSLVTFPWHTQWSTTCLSLSSSLLEPDHVWSQSACFYGSLMLSLWSYGRRSLICGMLRCFACK